jgi:protein-S-isoprenylcysteine O-methyltransferase Ste14
MNANCKANKIGEMRGLIRFRPPRIALTCLAAAADLHVLSPKGTVLFVPYHLLGMLLLTAGFTIMIWSWVLFKKSKSAICPTSDAAALIKAGPYRFTRNPMYLGMALMLCGAAFLFGSVIAFSAPAAFFITMNEVFIPFEENNMERLFGDSYMEYKNRVRRWL